MTRVLTVVLLVIFLFSSLHAFALEDDNKIHKSIKTDISAAKTKKLSPGNMSKDLGNSSKAKNTEIAADHDHYGKFLLFNALLAGRKTRR